MAWALVIHITSLHALLSKFKRASHLQHAYVMLRAKLPLSLACYPASTRLPSRPKHRHFTHPRVLRNDRPCTCLPDDSDRTINISEQRDKYAKVSLCADYAPSPIYLALPIHDALSNTSMQGINPSTRHIAKPLKTYLKLPDPATWATPQTLHVISIINPRKEIFLQMIEHSSRDSLVNTKPCIERLFRHTTVFELRKKHLLVTGQKRT